MFSGGIHRSCAHVQEREKEIEVHTEASKFQPETSDKLRQLAWKFIAGKRVFIGGEVLRSQIRAAEEEKHKASHCFEAAHGFIPLSLFELRVNMSYS